MPQGVRFFRYLTTLECYISIIVKITSEECIPESCVNGEEEVETGFWWAHSKDFGNTVWM
jgi:hypothetical protein